MPERARGTQAGTHAKKESKHVQKLNRQSQTRFQTPLLCIPIAAVTSQKHSDLIGVLRGRFYPQGALDPFHQRDPIKVFVH